MRGLWVAAIPAGLAIYFGTIWAIGTRLRHQAPPAVQCCPICGLPRAARHNAP